MRDNQWKISSENESGDLLELLFCHAGGSPELSSHHNPDATRVTRNTDTYRLPKSQRNKNRVNITIEELLLRKAVIADFFKVEDFVQSSGNDQTDVLFLGYHHAYFKKLTNDYYVEPTKLFGLFGYIVTNAGAKKLLKVFPITAQIDSEIPKHFDKINAYAVTNKYRLVFSDRSSVHTKFGTDIQIREGYSSWSIYNYIIYDLLIIMSFIIIMWIIRRL